MKKSLQIMLLIILVLILIINTYVKINKSDSIDKGLKAIILEENNKYLENKN